MILSGIVGGLLIQPSLMLWCCLGIMLVNICCRRSWLILLVCLFCSFLAGFFAHLQKESILLNENEIGTGIHRLSIQPDTVKVNGDLLTFIAKSRNDKHDYSCRITLDSEEEQQFWKKNISSFTLDTKGTIEKASPQRNLLGFDYQLYLETIGVSGIYQIEEYQLEKTSTKVNFLQSLRRKLLLHMDRNFSQKVATYLKALLLGYRDNDFEEVRQVFSDSGLLHLFSLSGLHVHFFLGMIYYLLRRLQMTQEASFLPLVLIAFCFYYLAGGSMSVARALLFFLVTRGTKTLRWNLSSLDRFSISLILLLVIKPYVFYSLSGLLSIAISLLVLLLSDAKEEGRLAFLKTALLLQGAALPLVATFFYELPIFSGLLGLFFIPIFQYWVLPLCFAVFMMSFLPFLSILTSFLAFILEQTILLIERIVTVFSNTTISGVGNPNFVLLLLLLTAILFLQMIHQRRRIAAFICFVILCLPLYQKYLDPRGMLAFVDVGQGDSIFLKAPYSQETILIDTGGQLAFEREAWQKRKQRAASEYQLIPFLKSQGVAQLDKLVITHADEDHMGEVLTVSRQIKIKQLYLAKGVEKNPKMQPILQQLTQLGTEIILLQAGETIGEKFKLHVLQPFGEVLGENNDSLVLFFKEKEKSFLLTGDLEADGETTLITSYPGLQADVLKVGHHGSKTSSSEAFIQHIQPQTAVISCGLNNRFGHPHEEVLDNLKAQKIYRTDESGMIYYTWSSFQPMKLQKVIQ